MSLAPAADIRKNPVTARDSTDCSTPTPSESAAHVESAKDDSRKKRSLFSFGKKKTSEKAAPDASAKSESSIQGTPLARGMSQRSSAATSPGLADAPHMVPASPSRGGVYSASPRVASPATSQIFERDVQESAAAMPNSPAIPSHIQVENHIPPALDATSEAITDGRLDPDSVEIVTHASHQPASATVAGGSSIYETQSSSWVDELQSLAEKEEAASNYGSLDSADVRRLSFISFADVVQAEQSHGIAASSRESVHIPGLTSLSSAGVNRSPSPIRSPISSQGAETSPPTSKSGSIRGLDMSPSRKPIGSPTSAHQNLGAGISGDLNIETMSQALRRTGSADLSGARSLPISPIEGMSR